MRRSAVSLACFLMVLLSACNRPSSAAHDYAERLQSVLNTDLVLQDSFAPKIPSQRELRQITQTSEISIREFLSLRQCKLHTVIAHRNSLMGKVAVDSQLLLNDLEIIQHTPACIAVLGEDAMATKLKSFLAAKRTSLQAAKWNAILAGPEFQQFWSSSQLNAGYPAQANQEAIITLERLTDYAQTTIDVDTAARLDNIETILGVLRQGDGGQLVEAYVQMGEALELANRAVKQRLERPLCLQTKPTPAAQNLRNVVIKYFIANVQSKSVELQRRSQQLMPAVRALEDHFEQLQTTEYRRWRIERDALISRTQALVTDHAQLLQRLFQQCGLQAGA